MARKPKEDPREIVTYRHHGTRVFVRRGNMGEHRKQCLCYSCSRFDPNFRNRNCPIANELYDLCVRHSVVTPVWECPDYLPLEEPCTQM